MDLLAPLSQHPYQTIILSGCALGDAAATIAGPALLKLAKRECLHTVILSDIIATLSVEEALRSLSSLSSSIGTFKQLRAVDLSHNALGSPGIAQCAPLLEGQPFLERVNLSDTGLAAESARLLSSYLTSTTPTQLRALNVRRNRLDSSGVFSLATVVDKSPQLESLRISSLGANATSIARMTTALSVTTSLRELDISDNGFDPECTGLCAQLLAKQSQLSSLALADLGIGDDGLREILYPLIDKRVALRKLNLSGNELTASGADIVASCITAFISTLESLDVSSNELGDDGIQKLTESLLDPDEPTHLKELNISEIDANSLSIVSLAKVIIQLEDLELFDISNNSMTQHVGDRVAAAFGPSVLKFDEGEPCDEDENNTEELEAALVQLEQLAQSRSRSVDSSPSVPQGVSKPLKEEDSANDSTSAEPSAIVEDTSESTAIKVGAAMVATAVISDGAADASETSTPAMLDSSSPAVSVTESVEDSSMPKEDTGSPKMSTPVATRRGPDSIAAGSVDGSDGNGEVINSARKLKESIETLTRDLSAVTGELQISVSPTLAAQRGLETVPGSSETGEDENDYLLVGPESETTKSSVTAFVDFVGALLVAAFVVVCVLAIVLSQEEATFPNRLV